MPHNLRSPDEIVARGLEPRAPWRPPAADFFGARARRLAELAEGHAMADFLRFAAALAQGQQRLLEATPVVRPDDALVARCREHGLPPLGAHGAALPADWDRTLAALVDHVWPHAPEPLRAALAALTPAAAQDEARRILRLERLGPDLATAPIVAAALQIAWTAGARSLSPGDIEITAEASTCPVCASPPVASIVRIGDAGHGVRYAVCSLCGSEWHVTRVKCVACLGTQGVSYRALEAADGPRHPAVKAETCDGCGASLKIVSMEDDPRVEAFADDLATLALDVLVDEAGYTRAGRNLFLFTPDPETHA